MLYQIFGPHGNSVVTKSNLVHNMYLYNKNILEYAQIMVNHTNFRILGIEDHSNTYAITYIHSYYKEIALN